MSANWNRNLATPCGLYYGECLYYEKPCKGCAPSGGKPSWGKCKTYACTTEKKVEHCGECGEFPCKLFLRQYSRELGPWRVFYKAGQLLYRKKIGTTAWVNEKAKGKNADPKVVMERCLNWEKMQKKKPERFRVEANMVSSKGTTKHEKLVFASAMFPGETSEKKTLLLIESIRAFAGSLSQAPIWCFTLDKEGLSKKTIARLSALDAKLIHFEIDAETPQFPFIRKALVNAQIESTAEGKADLLAWLEPDTIVLQEPNEFLLREGKSFGYRPVHHINIGSRYDDPLNLFWTQIYRYCRAPEDRVFAMTTHVDGVRVRPYFNAGLLIVHPKRRLLQTWRDTFLIIYGATEFEELYEKDERYKVFMHQAVLAGTVLSTLRPDEIEELPSTYNYPLHLYEEDVTALRPSYLEELVTFRYEDFFESPEWEKKIPAKEPLKQWIAERLL